MSAECRQLSEKKFPVIPNVIVYNFKSTNNRGSCQYADQFIFSNKDDSTKYQEIQVQDEMKFKCILILS